MAANSNKNSLGGDIIEQALDVIISAADAPKATNAPNARPLRVRFLDI